MNVDKNQSIFVAGATGMVGSAIVRNLKINGFKNIFYTNRKQLDFTNKIQVYKYFKKYRFDQLYIAAAKVGGIKANNDYPVDFLLENISIQTNLLSAAYEFKIKNVLFLGSSCIYPKHSKQPIKEQYLLNGKLEETNEFYAIAKISGIKLCEAYNKQYLKNSNFEFRSIMPCNLYGIGDNYNPNQSHVIPALIHKFHLAKKNNFQNVNVWGSGNAKREFLYVDDLANACIKFINLDKKYIKKKLNDYVSFINVGSGQEITIKKLAYLIAELVQFKGKILFNKNEHEGVNRKLLNNEMINRIGWRPTTSLKEGLKISYKDYLNSIL